MALVVRDLAATRPDETALLDERAALTWPELDDALNRATNALLAMDLGPRRRIAVMAENAAETAIVHVAALLAGVSAVPVNFHLKPAEVAYILAVAEAPVVFCGPETVAVAREAAADVGLPHVIAWRSGDGTARWEELLRDASPAEPPTDHPPLPNLMFTSGTTGRPKAVDLPPTMFAGGRDVAEFVGLLPQHFMAGLGPHLVVGPMYHTGPLTAVRLLACGNPVVVLGRFDPERVLDAITQHGVATSVMVPTHFVRLLALPEPVRERFDQSSLRLVAQTGASCPLDVKRAMIDWWGPVFLESYGATEVGVVSSIDSEEWLAHPGSVGRAVEPFEALILDDEGNPLPSGRSGHLYFRDATGRGLVYAHDAGDAVARPDGLFTLGEIGHLDDDGYIFITDRASDMVVSGGVNVYPAEAEAVLRSHPAVSDVAGIGVPDDVMGERLVAVVVRHGDGAGEDDLLAFCRERLSHYKCPREIRFADALPRTAMGKLDKKALRSEHARAAAEVR